MDLRTFPILGTSAVPSTPDVAVTYLLGVLRGQLLMDLGWLLHIDHGQPVLQAQHGDGTSFGLSPATVLSGKPERLERCLYWHVLTGALPSIVPDTRADPRTADLPGVTDFNIGSYAAAPIRDQDDGVYGLVGCLGREARPLLGSRHAEILALFADLLRTSVHDLRQMWERASRIWHDVRRILDAGGPGMVFQPVVDLRTGAAVGVEALARFPAPPANPERWFAAAATVGLGTDLELAAVRRALRALPDLPLGTRLAVNVSPTTLIGDLDDLLDDVDIDLEGLVIEVTEQERGLNDPAVLDAAERLRARGVLIAVDDIGSGYAGLQRLVDLRPEVIKLDRCLTRGIDADPIRRAAASAIVNIAEVVGSRTIAEGIETEAELTAVRAAGIHYGQGFHLGRPSSTLPASLQVAS
jgi:EAL domain-containing protein (putative c-di-GMP-specific phosphodiesterase class I)